MFDKWLKTYTLALTCNDSLQLLLSITHFFYFVLRIFFSLSIRTWTSDLKKTFCSKGRLPSFSNYWIDKKCRCQMCENLYIGELYGLKLNLWRAFVMSITSHSLITQYFYPQTERCKTQALTWHYYVYSFNYNISPLI